MIVENDSHPQSKYGVITSNRFKVNSGQKPRIWVRDNFYEDPDSVRQYALSHKLLAR